MGIWKAKLKTNLTFTFLKLKKMNFNYLQFEQLIFVLDFFTESQVFLAMF